MNSHLTPFIQSYKQRLSCVRLQREPHHATPNQATYTKPHQHELHNGNYVHTPHLKHTSQLLLKLHFSTLLAHALR